MIICHTYQQDYTLTAISVSQDCPMHYFDEGSRRVYSLILLTCIRHRIPYIPNSLNSKRNKSN